MNLDRIYSHLKKLKGEDAFLKAIVGIFLSLL